MNLADAIRQAAQGVPFTPAPKPAPEPQEVISEGIVAQPHPELQMPEAPGIEPVSPMVVGGNAVRLELFLTAEQMNAMLRAIMAGHHTVMTLREAAQYLRVQSTVLEKMATEGILPAFTLEGRWRFPKATLDEWLAMQSMKGQEEQNVA